jgi:hypothetical protein
MEKVFEIELTLDELEILGIALAPSDRLSHDICYDCMIWKRSDYVKRLEMASGLRDRINDIVEMNRKNTH